MAKLVLVVQYGPIVALCSEELFERFEHGCWRIVYDYIEDNCGRVYDELEPDINADEYAGGRHCNYNSEGIILQGWSG